MSQRLREHIQEIVALSDDEFEFIQAHFSQTELEKEQYIFRAGEKVDRLYFVLSGLLKLDYTDSNGKDHIMSFALEDWWVSDNVAFLTRKQASLSLQALEDTSLLALSFDDFQKLLANSIQMQGFFLTKANFGYIGAQNRILSLLSTSAKERYLQLLKQYPALSNRVSKTLLASYLGISRETLSRLSSQP